MKKNQDRQFKIRPFLNDLNLRIKTRITQTKTHNSIYQKKEFIIKIYNVLKKKRIFMVYIYIYI